MIIYYKKYLLHIHDRNICVWQGVISRELITFGMLVDSRGLNVYVYMANKYSFFHSLVLTHSVCSWPDRL